MGVIISDSTEARKRLNSTSVSIDNQIDALTNINSIMTSSGWKGNTSNNFNNKIDEYLKSLQRLSETFKDLENKIAIVNSTSQTLTEELSSGA